MHAIPPEDEVVMVIKYRTVKTREVMSESDLKKLGIEGWTLGGVVTVQVSVQGVIVPRHAYHFWRKES